MPQGLPLAIVNICIALFTLTGEAKIVADLWNKEPKEVKASWAQKAEKEEFHHNEKYSGDQFSATESKNYPIKRKASASHRSIGSRPHKDAKIDTV